MNIDRGPEGIARVAGFVLASVLVMTAGSATCSNA
jgi:hypothetical protein